MKNHFSHFGAWAAVLIITNTSCGAFAAIIRMPTVSVSVLEHSPPTESQPFPSFPKSYSMYDAVTVGFAENEGSAFVEPFIGTWDIGDTIIFRIEAIAGHRFRATPHPNASFNTFSSHTSFLVDGGSSLSSNAIATFENLNGTLPVPEQLRGSTGTIGQWVGASFDYRVTSPFTFTAVELEFLAAGPGDLSTRPAWQTFGMNLNATSRSELSDQSLLQIEPIPEPVSLTLAAVSLFLISGSRRRFDDFK